jgi:hypothetical protein
MYVRLSSLTHAQTGLSRQVLPAAARLDQERRIESAFMNRDDATAKTRKIEQEHTEIPARPSAGTKSSSFRAFFGFVGPSDYLKRRETTKDG